jgi:two-component system, cell cycle response regulator DivK
MSPRFASERLADVRQDAQLLIEHAGDQEGQLEAFVAAAEEDLRHAESAVSHADEVADADEVRRLLCAQLARSAASATAAKRLLACAHQQQAAAQRLLAHLRDDHAGERCSTAVLVVDDYGDVREAVADVLQNAGFIVRTASDGLEALIAAYEMRPGVIVMDVSMPVLDGLEATRLIKACAATRDARVIAYTGNPTFDESPTRRLFAAVLTKPATPDAVLAAVRHTANL